MTEAIDWSAPLEAYHPDGSVFEVEFSHGPDSDGDYFTQDHPNVSEDSWHSDGRSYCGRKWRIRNRKTSEGVTPELVEALQAGGRVIDYAASILWNGRPQAIAQRPAEVDADLRTFRSILAEYEAATKPPVDPLVANLAEALRDSDPEGCDADWSYQPQAETMLANAARHGLTITKAEAS